MVDAKIPRGAWPRNGGITLVPNGRDRVIIIIIIIGPTMLSLSVVS